MLVLFDIDDTLLDHTAAVHDAVAVLHSAIPSDAPLADFQAAWAVAMKTHFPRFLAGILTYEEQRRARLRQTVAPAVSDTEADELFAIYFAAYEAKWALFPDVVPCLDGLGDRRLGVISNGQSAEQRRKLASTGIAERFELVHISDACGAPKPSRDIFLGACQAAGVAPDNAVYVGDLYETDAVGAREAGLRGIWLDRTGARTAEHAPPILGALTGLAELLREVPYNGR
jgi:putative hydrolase of the HAD superfamily